MVNKGKKYRGGSKLSKLSPFEIQFTPGGKSPDPNTLGVPTRFSDNNAKLAGRGCAGDLSNVDGAAAKYVPYQTGGSSLVCLNSDLINGEQLPGRAAGHASNISCGPDSNTVRSLGLSPGKTATSPWNGSGGRRRRRTRRKRRRAKSKRVKRRRHKTMKRRSKMHRSKMHRKKSKKSRKRRRVYRGGTPQPYSNIPLSFGYGLGAPFNGSTSDIADNSAFANPPPLHAYNHCEKNNFGNGKSNSK
jgi:hypothetical protein